MLKLVFWFLLALNIVVFASTVDYPNVPETQAKSGRSEPVEQNKIRILSSSLDTPSTPAVKEKKRKSTETECIELENFSLQDADLFEKKMGLPDNRISRLVAARASHYMVYIPPFKNTRMAEKRISELKAKGITNYFLIPEGSRFRHAISLGIFKTEQSARQLIAELERQGVHDAQITARGKISESVSLRMSNLDSNQIDHLNALLSDFPQVTKKDCNMATEVVQ